MTSPTDWLISKGTWYAICWSRTNLFIRNSPQIEYMDKGKKNLLRSSLEFSSETDFPAKTHLWQGARESDNWSATQVWCKIFHQDKRFLCGKKSWINLIVSPINSKNRGTHWLSPLARKNWVTSKIMKKRAKFLTTSNSEMVTVS